MSSVTIAFHIDRGIELQLKVPVFIRIYDPESYLDQIVFITKNVYLCKNMIALLFILVYLYTAICAIIHYIFVYKRYIREVEKINL